MSNLRENFSAAAKAVGSLVLTPSSYHEIADHITKTIKGSLALPNVVAQKNPTLTSALTHTEIDIVSDDFRERAADLHGGLTWGQYGIAETGSVLVQSTDEDIRLSSTLPEIHYLLLNESNILANAKAATPIMREIFTGGQAEFVAWVTGPSRTADIERVLTIGVHGPKELHIFLLPDNIEEISS